MSMFLVIVFASQKAKQLELEEKIASVIEKFGIQVDVRHAEMEQVGSRNLHGKLT